MISRKKFTTADVGKTFYVLEKGTFDSIDIPAGTGLRCTRLPKGDDKTAVFLYAVTPDHTMNVRLPAAAVSENAPVPLLTDLYGGVLQHPGDEITLQLTPRAEIASRLMAAHIAGDTTERGANYKDAAERSVQAADTLIKALLTIPPSLQ